MPSDRRIVMDDVDMWNAAFPGFEAVEVYKNGAITLGEIGGYIDRSSK